MNDNQFDKIENTKVYLQSSRNRKLYPKLHYPITHLLDEFNRQRLRLKADRNIPRFKYSLIILSIGLFVGIVFFQLHIRIYNSTFGPFHVNLNDFIHHVNAFQKNFSYTSFLWRKEYFQVELGENNVLNSLDKYSTIRQYFDPVTRRYHIATYKRIKNPSIYVKLPTPSQSRYHIHFPFHFMSYSISTLRCIVKNLPSNSRDTYQTWFEKSEYVRYIEDQYRRNSTDFNKAVLTKCGILIGYLFWPKGEKVFTSTDQHRFSADDIALNMTHQYFSPYLYFIIGLIFTWLFVKSFFYLMRYLIIRIRCDYLHKFGICSWPLKLLPAVAEELWLLNIDAPIFEQLIRFDEYLKKSQNKYDNRLAIIKNDEDYLFVVILMIDLHEKLNLDDRSSPFVICPVTDIQKMTFYNGICYGSQQSWIPWPAEVSEERNYSTWLHDELMEISTIYRTKFQKRLHDEHTLYDSLPANDSTHHRQMRNTRERNHRTLDTGRLNYLIREEENFQSLRMERRAFYDIILSQDRPASPRFIATFREVQERSKKLVSKEMDAEQITCVICQNDLRADQHYAQWPCSNSQQHVFHYACMLSLLRTRNTCPICRYEVEPLSITSHPTIIQMFNMIFFR